MVVLLSQLQATPTAAVMKILVHSFVLMLMELYRKLSQQSFSDLDTLYTSAALLQVYLVCQWCLNALSLD